MLLLRKLIVIKVHVVVLLVLVEFLLVPFFIVHLILYFLRFFGLLTTFLGRRSFAIAVCIFAVACTSDNFFFRIEPLYSLDIVRLAKLIVLAINNVRWLVCLGLIRTVAADHISVAVLVFAQIVINLLLVVVRRGRLVVAHIFFRVSHCES